MYPLLFRIVLSHMDPESAHHLAMAVIRVLGVPPFSWAARAVTIRRCRAPSTISCKPEISIACRCALRSSGS